MILGILALSFQQPSAAQNIFSAAERALARKSLVSVVVNRDIEVNKQRESFRESIAIQFPSIIHYRSQGTVSSKLDRSVLINGTELTMVDHIANEYIQRRFTGKGLPLDRLRSVVGAVDAVDALAVDVQALTTYLVGLQQRKDLKIETTTTMVRVTAGKNIIVGFDPRSHLPKLLDVTVDNRKLHATFDYKLDANMPTLPIPALAKQVQVFDEAPLGAKFATPAAKTIATACADVFRTFLSGKVDITDDSGTTLLAFSDRRFREQRGAITWAYDGSQLTIINAKTGKTYRGPSTRPRVPVIVGSLGGQVDAFTIRLLRREFPLADLMTDKRQVSDSGSMEISGVAYDILRSDAFGSRVSILIRRDSHLPESVSADALDMKGNLIFTSIRKFKFEDLNKTLPESITGITLPANANPAPLPVVRG